MPANTGLGSALDTAVPMKTIEEMTEIERAAFQVDHHRRHRHVGPACAEAFEDALDRLLALTR